MNRDSFIFYRSFFEAIKEMSDNDRLIIYDAICDYSLNENELELSGSLKTIWTLIKPNLEANNKRYKAGKKGGRPKADDNQDETKDKPKPKQPITTKEPNKDVDKDEDKDKDKEIILHPIQDFVIKQLPAVSKLKKQLTTDECEKLEKKYSLLAIKRTLEDMENYKPLTQKYSSVYLTLNNWIPRNGNK